MRTLNLNFHLFPKTRLKSIGLVVFMLGLIFLTACQEDEQSATPDNQRVEKQQESAFTRFLNQFPRAILPFSNFEYTGGQYPKELDKPLFQQFIGKPFSLNDQKAKYYPLRRFPDYNGFVLLGIGEVAKDGDAHFHVAVLDSSGTALDIKLAAFMPGNPNQYPPSPGELMPGGILRVSREDQKLLPRDSIIEISIIPDQDFQLNDKGRWIQVEDEDSLVVSVDQEAVKKMTDEAGKSLASVADQVSVPLKWAHYYFFENKGEQKEGEQWEGNTFELNLNPPCKLEIYSESMASPFGAMTVKAVPKGGKMEVRFGEYLKGNGWDQYAEDDLLFTLSREEGDLITTWKKMKPLYGKQKTSGEYFFIRK